jgi:hypothetical protein
MRWKKIPLFPYEISDTGLVRREDTHRVLKPMRCGRKARQYLTVRLGDGAFQGDFRVHNLVLEVFIGPRPEGMVGCHKDDDPENNHLDNLYWGTPKSNVADRCRNHNRLTMEQANEIRRRRNDGEHGRALAREYGVSEQMICDIVKGRSYCSK